MSVLAVQLSVDSSAFAAGFGVVFLGGFALLVPLVGLRLLQTMFGSE